MMEGMSKMKIEALTKHQVAQFERYVREWIAIGTCTEPADRPRAEAAINQMYAMAGLKSPGFVWCDSPLSMCMTRYALGQMGASVGASVGDSVRASVRDSVGDSVWASVFGQHEAGWLAFYRYFRDECGLVDETSKLSGLWELAQSCGWIIPCKDICFVSERHTVCRLDERGLIHSETGPAIAYRDGFAVYGWHGTRIPANWIEQPESLTPQVALSQENSTLRIAAMQIIGWPKMIDLLDGKVIDRHPEGLIGGELVEVAKAKFNPAEAGSLKFLRAQCPRNGLIAFRVPDDIKTSHEAQAWKAGLPADIYKLPAIRT